MPPVVKMENQRRIIGILCLLKYYPATMNNPSVQELKARILQCMIRDRFRFRKEIDKGHTSGRLIERIAGSVSLAESRKNSIPQVSYPEGLPISARVGDIATAIKHNQVVIISGETGSGKTTQIPKICLDAGLGIFGMIGHTQPRRLATRTVSRRITDELGVKLGEQVGYQVRFTNHTNEYTHVKIMTDGILLAETQQDRFLEQYEAIIIDEAHERSLNIDFLLGYIKKILPRRPDLKVIITSATIDIQKFSSHFNNAPIIEVSGRTYPVEVLYRPSESSKSRDSDELMYAGILDSLFEIEQLEKSRRNRGDTLIFLPGEREIREVAAAIRRSDLDTLEILPLYSRLGVAEQNRVFQSHHSPRVVLATNVAETSLTVPGIRYVIDPGLARISRYSIRSKVQQLPVEPISQASAEQRKGRCGRISEGVCIRLYDEEDFVSRPEFTQPEIMRTNLAWVILQMLILRLGGIDGFPFVERPNQRQINDGFHLLFELQAVDENRRITSLGRTMAKFPVDLRFARMLVEANRARCLSEVITITSALSVQDPRERPYDHQQAADEAHRRYVNQQSDFLAFVNLWNSHEEARQELTANQLRKYCRSNFLSFVRMREWRDIHRQLHLLCRELKFRENRELGDYASIHQALLCGLLGNIGEKTGENDYAGARSRTHYIFPGSSQFKRKPKWIVSGELMETTRLYARNVAGIDNKWVEPLARHLVNRRCFDPYFDPDRGQVFTYEAVTLYGITIVKRRRVDLSAIDPIQARKVFIQSGLVEQQLNSSTKFYEHNKRLIADTEKLETKTRKRDILVDNRVLYDFYDQRLPEYISSEINLLDFIKKNPKKSELLYLHHDQLIQGEVNFRKEQYPDTINVAGAELKLEYHFDPQHEDDGVSINVPVAILREVGKAQLDWLIPGLLREKCLALIRSLPRSLRRNFIPAQEYADKVIEHLEFDGRELTEVLAMRLFRMTGTRVVASDFNEENLDRHLNMNIQVLDDTGRKLGSGRNIEVLRETWSREVEQSFKNRSRHSIEKEELTNWTFGDLPEQVEFKHADMKVKGFPALVDKGESVAIEIMDSQQAAVQKGNDGLLRLIRLQLKEQEKYIHRNIEQFTIFHADRGHRDKLLANIVHSIFRITFVEGLPAVTSESAFHERLMEKGHLITTMNEVTGLLQIIFKETGEIRESLSKRQTALNGIVCDDIRQQLDGLLGMDFPRHVPRQWLRQYPRFLKAIKYRLDKLQGNLVRDREATQEIARYTERLEQDTLSDDARHFRWMLEEYRVSLFAQAMGTSIPVSARRLDKYWGQ